MRLQDVLLIVGLTVLFNGGGLIAVAFGTRKYRRRQAAQFAASIVYATTDRTRDLLLDLQDALSAHTLEEARNRVDHALDTQRAHAEQAATQVAEQVQAGGLPQPLTPLAPIVEPRTEGDGNGPG